MNARLEVPKISPLPQDSHIRPFWSVMIPVYNPCTNYLKETLQSVLQQDPDPRQMQIEIVDDCSPAMDVESVIKSIAGDRVVFSKTPKNLGLAGCWNTCIERARGEWVHILHQDDLVMPGFHKRLRDVVSLQPGIGVAFTRHVLMDENGHWIRLSELHRKDAGVLSNWLEQLGMEQLIQCPAIVVKRSTYEKVGGFNSRLRFALDWEMWQRIAVDFPFWFEPQILAAYRVHGDSETARLVQNGCDADDIRMMIEVTRSYYRPEMADRIVRNSSLRHALLATHKARALLVKGNKEAAWKQIGAAFRLSKAPSVWSEGFLFIVLQARLVGSRCKRALKRSLHLP